MISLRATPIKSVVALGAHPDDIEIAAGGLLLRLAATSPNLRVHYVVLTGSSERHAEARAAAAAFLPGTADVTVQLHDLRDGHVPAQWAEAKRLVQQAAATLTADLVLAPRSDDAHQDHRLLGELAPQAFRDQLVLHYEIPKWDGDIGRPNVYVELPTAIAARKVELLNACFPSQKSHDWWDDELFLGMMRVRGMECRSRYAEAFFCDKATLQL